nr:PEPxxWA-CTERM sorting domain-containing protein [Polymorphobacter sp.]
MKNAIFAVLAATALGTTTPALADSWLFGFSPAGQQLLTGGSSAIQASQTGWFDSAGIHNAGNSNYFVGSFGSSLSLRNYFSFNVSGNFTTAALAIGNAGGVGSSGGFNPGTGSSVTWTLYDLGTTINTSQNYNNISIFNDLGTGTVYGSVTVSGATTLVTVALNSAGLSALNAAAGAGTAFNVGGALSSGAVPEPASWAMLIAGFGLVGAAMRRRSAAIAA